MSTPVLLSVNEAAKSLGISRASVYLLISHGELDSLRVGRLRRIPRRSLDDFVESGLALQRQESSPSRELDSGLTVLE